jgi:predicted secreted protein
MSLIAGTNFIFKIYNGSTYDTIGACTSNSFTMNNGIVDVSNKDSVWETSLDGVGKKSATIELTGFSHSVSGNVGYEALKDLSRNASASQKQFEIVLGDGEKITAVFDLTSFAETGADAQGKTFTASLKMSGSPTVASV